MQIQISWLLQKPADLDLHCLLRKGMSCSAREGLNIICGKEKVSRCITFELLEMQRFIWYYGAARVGYCSRTLNFKVIIIHITCFHKLSWVCTVCICHFVRKVCVQNFRTTAIPWDVFFFFPQLSTGLWKFLNLNRSSRWRHQWAHFQKKNMYISPVTKTNDNWQSYNSF